MHVCGEYVVRILGGRLETPPAKYAGSVAISCPELVLLLSNVLPPLYNPGSNDALAQ